MWVLNKYEKITWFFFLSYFFIIQIIELKNDLQHNCNMTCIKLALKVKPLKNGIKRNKYAEKWLKSEKMG